MTFFSFRRLISSFVLQILVRLVICNNHIIKSLYHLRAQTHQYTDQWYKRKTNSWTIAFCFVVACVSVSFRRELCARFEANCEIQNYIFKPNANNKNISFIVWIVKTYSIQFIIILTDVHKHNSHTHTHTFFSFSFCSV